MLKSFFPACDCLGFPAHCSCIVFGQKSCLKKKKELVQRFFTEKFGELKCKLMNVFICRCYVNIRLQFTKMNSNGGNTMKRDRNGDVGLFLSVFWSLQQSGSFSGHSGHILQGVNIWTHNCMKDFGQITLKKPKMNNSHGVFRNAVLSLTLSFHLLQIPVCL